MVPCRSHGSRLVLVLLVLLVPGVEHELLRAPAFTVIEVRQQPLIRKIQRVRVLPVVTRNLVEPLHLWGGRAMMWTFTPRRAARVSVRISSQDQLPEPSRSPRTASALSADYS